MNTCKRCGEKFYGDAEYDDVHSDVGDCVTELKAKNDTLKQRLDELEERFERVLNRHNLDDSKYGRDW